jgi:hypothetical protein
MPLIDRKLSLFIAVAIDILSLPIGQTLQSFTDVLVVVRILDVLAFLLLEYHGFIDREGKGAVAVPYRKCPCNLLSPLAF